MRLIPFLLLFAVAGLANAVETVIEYELPSHYCDGRAVDPGDLAALEIYVSAAPIPAADLPCPAAGGEVDPAPDSFSTKIDAAPNPGSATVDLFPGMYYVRARIQDVEGQWSNLSNQIEREIPAGPLSAPVLIRMTF